MTKRLLLLFSFFALVGVSSLTAQNIVGGGGVVYVDDNPNNIAALNNMSVNEAHIAYDTSAQVVYFFDQTGTAGTDQWIGFNVANVVTSVVGANDITVTNVGGVYTVDFTEALTTLGFDVATNVLTYTDEDGNTTTLDLTGAVDVNGSNSITVTGTGDAADPYVIKLAGADTGANANKVPVTDGSGNLSWSAAVRSIELATDATHKGAIKITLVDGTVSYLDLDGAPKVANISELNTAASNLAAGTSGIAVAADTNTFGLPANSKVGVLFFIKK